MYFGMYVGVAIPLSFGFVAGVLIPVIYNIPGRPQDWSALIILLLSGVGLTLIFLALSFLISVRHEDRIRGLGMSVILWLFFTVIYDGLMLVLIYLFADYPLDKAVLVFSLLNPIDLARVLLLMEFDISALMGYTGAVFQNFFGGLQGMVVLMISMFIWITLPFYFGLRHFSRKDL
jgi:Cu-processing system permease protein